ncbi:hypothetical protein H4S02_000620 [Coemansia sp. RSA 2611]|nr:hypothetical protein H4S02_000620 [Coemansia sp. RSA 2611]
MCVRAFAPAVFPTIVLRLSAVRNIGIAELRPALFPGATLCILQPVLNASSCIMRANVGFLNTFELFRYNHEVLGGTSARPASAIRRLRPLPYPRRGFAVENVLVDDGTLLPTTTMATLQTKGRVQRILLGSVMADHIAICRARPYSQYSQS